MNLNEAILGRRSIRKYTEQRLSDKDVESIVQAGLHAPSGINQQPWYYLVLRSPEALSQFKAIMDKTYANFEPVLKKRFSRNPEVVEETKSFLTTLGGASTCILVFLLKPDYEDEISVVQGVSAGIQNMLLTAYGLGLGSCWMTAPVTAGLGEEIRTVFAPDKGKLVAAITLGYPDESPKMPPRREGRFNII